MRTISTLLRNLSRILLYPAALCAVSAIPPYLLNLTAPDGTALHPDRLTMAVCFLAASVACRMAAAKLHPPTS